MDKFESLNHTAWDCKYHVVFIPKCRRRTLYGQLRQHLGEVFRKLAAAKFLDAWCKRAMRSRIEPVKKFARTVRRHRELLLNYFRAKKQFSSGVIEGLNRNNKAKVTLRKAYGYRTFRIAELSLYHVLGRPPEPKLAHRFF